MIQLLQDWRVAIRSLFKRPLLTLGVALTLGLGIGASTLMFSILESVVMRPLPYDQPEGLVVVWNTDLKTGQDRDWTSFPDLADYRANSRSLASLAGYRLSSATLTGADLETVRLNTGFVSADLFTTLRVQPAMGRVFNASEDSLSGDPAVVLSHQTWSRLFRGQQDILGRSLNFDGKLHTVVGVMAADFDFPAGSQVWMPLAAEAGEDERGQHRLQVVGRLADSTSMDQSTSELRQIAQRLAEEYPDSNSGTTVVLESLHEVIVGDIRPALMILQGVVAFVLLIACTNVANLLLNRASERWQELHLRRVLGAKPWHLVRQFLVENLLLYAIGGGLGLGLAVLGLWGIKTLEPTHIPRLQELSLNGRTIIFLLGLTFVTSVTFGLIPAWRALRVGSETAPRGNERVSTGNRRSHLLHQALLATEVALALMLMVGAGLLLKSLWQLQKVDPGFRSEHLLNADIALPISNYPRKELGTSFFTELIARVEALPGVTSAAAAYAHPLASSWTTSFTIVNREEVKEGEEPEARLRPVTPGYFKTVGIPLLEGRTFTEHDDGQAPGAIIINRSFAHHHFPSHSPLGEHLTTSGWWEDLPTNFEIVGVVDNVKFDGLDATADWAMYFPHRQLPLSQMSLVVRTASDPTHLMGPIRAAVWEGDPTLAIDNVATFDSMLHESLAQPRFYTLSLGLFALIGLVLALIGIYAVMAYSVNQRRNEIGIRMALGARSEDVLQQELRRALKITLFGIAGGLLGAWAATRLLATWLYDVAPSDPTTLLLVCLLMVAVALLAGLIPAWRASRLDPNQALQYE